MRSTAPEAGADAHAGTKHDRGQVLVGDRLHSSGPQRGRARRTQRRQEDGVDRQSSLVFGVAGTMGFAGGPGSVTGTTRT